LALEQEAESEVEHEKQEKSTLFRASLVAVLKMLYGESREVIKDDFCENLRISALCGDIWSEAEPLLKKLTEDAKSKVKEYLRSNIDRILDAISNLAALNVIEEHLGDDEYSFYIDTIADTEIGFIEHLAEKASPIFENILREGIRKISEELKSKLITR